MQDADAETFGRRFWRSDVAVFERLEALSSSSVNDQTFRLLADNIPALCWIANGDGYIVWYNRRWHDYCGTTPEQMEGWGWTEVHSPERLPAVMERWGAAVASREPFEMTFPLRGADGVFRPFLTRVQPLRDAGGEVARWFGVNTEISDQVAAERALGAERDLSRSVIEGMAESFALLDGEFRVLALNAEAMRLETRSREEIIGRTHWDAYPGSEHSEVGLLYKRAVVEGAPVALEHRYEWEDGRAAWLDMRAYPVGLVWRCSIATSPKERTRRRCWPARETSWSDWSKSGPPRGIVGGATLRISSWSLMRTRVPRDHSLGDANARLDRGRDDRANGLRGELGYRVLEAGGAAAALRLVDAHPEIALMFTDVVMPEVNGRKLADAARARRPDLKVLFTTGYTRNAVVHNGVLDVGVELIGKPFTIEELATTVRKALDAP